MCSRFLSFISVSGLDPASPYYTDRDPEVRLDPTDAKYVDVIHTNLPIIGTEQRVGHIDFFPNGGSVQPGCFTNKPLGEWLLIPPTTSVTFTQAMSENSYKSNQFTCMLMSDMRYSNLIESHHQFRFGLFPTFTPSPWNAFLWLETNLFPFADVIFTTSCHHLRAPEYYIATVQNQCSWKAYPCSSYLWFWSGLCNRCYGECPSMGYSADKTKHTGSYFLDTTSKKPFCGEHSVEAFAIFKSSLCNKFRPCSIAISVFLTLD